MEVLTTPAGALELVVEACDDPASAVQLVNRWLARGDGAAFYRNEDLGHHGLGHVAVVSYGSPDAQLESAEAPERLPDGLLVVVTGGINWRYRLIATYKGEALPVVSGGSDDDFPLIVREVVADEGTVVVFRATDPDGGEWLFAADHRAAQGIIDALDSDASVLVVSPEPWQLLGRVPSGGSDDDHPSRAWVEIPDLNADEALEVQATDGDTLRVLTANRYGNRVVDADGTPTGRDTVRINNVDYLVNATLRRISTLDTPQQRVARARYDRDTDTYVREEGVTDRSFVLEPGYLGSHLSRGDAFLGADPTRAALARFESIIHAWVDEYASAHEGECLLAWGKLRDAEHAVASLEREVATAEEQTQRLRAQLEPLRLARAHAKFLVSAKEVHA